MTADDPRPPYLQVADDLRQAIETGRIKPGAKLSSGRVLAQRYSVALMTVQKALRTLQADGLVVSHPGRGVFVRSADSDDEPQASAEFTALMDQIEGLRTAVTQAVGELDERLTRLEQAARHSTG